MDWNIVSMAVIFPISQGIVMGFNRRERALSEFSSLLGNLRAWGAVYTWQIKTASGEWRTAADIWGETQTGTTDLHQLAGQLLTSLVDYFDMPRTGRARHAVDICGGRVEEARLRGSHHAQRLMVDACLARLQKLVQSMKVAGLPGGEAHRLDQYISKVCVSFEQVARQSELVHEIPQAVLPAPILCMASFTDSPPDIESHMTALVPQGVQDAAGIPRVFSGLHPADAAHVWPVLLLARS